MVVAPTPLQQQQQQQQQQQPASSNVFMIERRHLECPITLQIMKDPVIAADGETYERAAIENILRQSTNTIAIATPATPGSSSSGGTTATATATAVQLAPHVVVHHHDDVDVDVRNSNNDDADGIHELDDFQQQQQQLLLRSPMTTNVVFAHDRLISNLAMKRLISEFHEQQAQLQLQQL